jgi:hypothetical protein
MGVTCLQSEASSTRPSGDHPSRDPGHLRVLDQLDSQLPPQRSVTGTPSRADFLAVEMPSIMHRFAEAFDELPEVVEGVGGARMLIARGLLVHAFVVYGLLADDGSVDLIGIAIDRRGPTQ